MMQKDTIYNKHPLHCEWARRDNQCPKYLDGMDRTELLKYTLCIRE